MKGQQFTILLFTGILIAFFHTVEAQWGAKGNGNVVKETRTVQNFTSIEVSSGIDLYLRQGTSDKVEVEADENLIEFIETKQSGKTLKINISKSIWKSTQLKVYVTTQDLESIRCAGGSDVYSSGTFKADKFEITAASGSDLKMEMEVGELSCQTSGGSDVELKGKVSKGIFYCNGGSDVAAKQLTVADAYIRTSGGSDVYVRVTKTIDVEASGASDVSVYGAPKVINSSTSGAADIHMKSI